MVLMDADNIKYHLFNIVLTKTLTKTVINSRYI